MRRAALPPRIWVVGPCGAGKSTVAARLAARLGVACTHLDEIHWRTGWVEASLEEDRAALARVIARPAWVVDGNYERLRSCHRDAIALYVWLDLPLHVTFPRLVRRGIVRSVRRLPVCNGNHESLRRTFLHRDSLLVYALHSDASRRRALVREVEGRPHVRLRAQRAIDRWLACVTASRPTRGPAATRPVTPRAAAGADGRCGAAGSP